jgi:hypothetical protein
MEENNLILLFQLTRTLQDSFTALKESYESKNAENFEVYKKSLLDIQNKISVLVK